MSSHEMTGAGSNTAEVVMASEDKPVFLTRVTAVIGEALVELTDE